MKVRSRLKHAAAGLLAFLVSRNNDVHGYWGPGLLYRDVSTAPHRIELDLLTGASEPASASADVMAAHAAALLRAALKKQGCHWDGLTLATITFAFNVRATTALYGAPPAGDRFVCSVSLRAAQGSTVDVHARSRCLPFRPGAFARRGAA